MSLSPAARIHLIVLAGFILLTLAFVWPLPLQMSTHLLGRGTDPELLIWALGWDAYALVNQPLSIFDANIFYPSRYSLAYSENMLGSAILVAPLIWTTGDLVLAMNLVQVSSIALSAFGAYLLARRLGLNVGAAIVAGVVFGFAPARFFRMPQAHLTTIQWIPYCLAYLHAYFSPAGRARDLRLAAAFFTLQALASGHGAVFLTVAALGLVAWAISTGTRLELRRRVGDLGVPGFLLLLPCAGLVMAYRAARTEVPNLERMLDDYGSSFASYLSSPAPVHQWLFQLVRERMFDRPPDAHLFVGITPVVLALVGIVALARALRDVERLSWRHPAAFYSILTLVAFWFTLGPPVGLWRFTHAFPVFSFLRVPSRFVLLEVLALGVLAAYGASVIAARVASRRRTVVAAALAGAMIVEFFPWGLETLPFQVEVTSADRWLSTRPRPVAVAEFPVPDSLDDTTQGRRNTLFMQHSTAHWHKTVHGFSGVEPQHFTELRPKLVGFPDLPSLNALADLGVTYVVIHPYLYERDQVDLAEIDARIDAFEDWLRVEYVSRDGRVYSLRRPSPQVTAATAP